MSGTCHQRTIDKVHRQGRKLLKISTGFFPRGTQLKLVKLDYRLNFSSYMKRSVFCRKFGFGNRAQSISGWKRTDFVHHYKRDFSATRSPDTTQPAKTISHSRYFGEAGHLLYVLNGSVCSNQSLGQMFLKQVKLTLSIFALQRMLSVEANTALVRNKEVTAIFSVCHYELPPIVTLPPLYKTDTAVAVSTSSFQIHEN